MISDMAARKLPISARVLDRCQQGTLALRPLHASVARHHDIADARTPTCDILRKIGERGGALARGCRRCHSRSRFLREFFGPDSYHPGPDKA